MLSENIDREGLEERLSKFKGRHFRLLNRLAVSRLEEGISSSSDLREINKELKKYFGDSSENEGVYPLIEGVSSAMYSRINHSIKDTRIDDGNLGLVIENNNVKTNYNLYAVYDFMKYAGVMDSEIFGKRFYFFPTKITYSDIAEEMEIIGSNVAGGAEIKGANVAERAKVERSYIVEGAKIIGSNVAREAKIIGSNVAREAKIISSDVAEEADIIFSRLGEGATITNSDVTRGAEVKGSRVGEGAELVNLDAKQK